MERTEETIKGHHGIDLYCQTLRPAAATGASVVYVHGLGDHSGRHRSLFDALCAAGHTVTAADLRGHGRSPGPRGHIDSWDDHREDLRAVVRFAASQRAGVPLFLIGHSLGGLVVLEYALRYPEGLRGVVAMSPGLSLDGIPRWQVVASRLLDRLAPRLTMKVGLDSTNISRDPSIKAADDEDPLCHSYATVRLGVEARRAIEFTLGHAAELRVPLLVVHGAADRVVPPAASLTFYQRVSLADKRRIEYPDAYHELDNDYARDQALADIRAWIAAHL